MDFWKKIIPGTRNGRILAGALAVVVIGGVIFLMVRPSEPEYTLSDYKKRAHQRELAGDSSEFENLFEGKVPELAFGAAKGQTLSFDYRLESKARVNMDYLVSAAKVSAGEKDVNKDDDSVKKLFGGKQDTSLLSEGRLYLKFYPAGNRKWNVAARLHNPKYEVNREETRLVDALRQPFAFEMNSRGQIERFLYTRGIPDQIQQVLRRVVYSLQTMLPAAPKKSWRTREFDGGNYYEAAYGLKDYNPKTERARVLKKYLRGSGGLRLPERSVATTLRDSRRSFEDSESTIEFVNGDAWVENVSRKQTEKLESRGGRTWGEGSSSFEASRAGKPGPGVFPPSFAAFKKQLNSEQYLSLKYYETDPYLNSLGRNRSMAEATEIFKKLRDQPDSGRLGEKFMVNYLRQYPDAAFDLVDELKKNDTSNLPEDTQHTLWRLLTEAGHPEAQRALATALSPQDQGIVRYRAVAYAHSFENPQPFLADELWKAHEQIPDTSDQENAELKAMTLYAIGTLGNPEKLNDATRAKTSRELSGYLNKVKSSHLKTAALSAIGNHGGNELLTSLKPYFNSKDLNLKLTAVEATRHMTSPTVRNYLHDRFESETNPRVKARIVFVLSKMPYRESDIAWVDQVIGNHGGKIVELAFATLLGKGAEESDRGKELLRKLAKTTKYKEVKTEIYKHIAP